MTKTVYHLALLALPLQFAAADSFTTTQPQLLYNEASQVAAKPGGLNLSERFKCFYPLNDEAEYSIMVCGDIPDNNDPSKVHVGKEPGHVFLILQKTDPSSVNKTVSQVFGFYPRRPASSIVFKNVRCEILDNGKREYNVSVHKKINAGEFRFILQRAQDLAKKKYNINKYNCYDYVIEVFNSLPGIEKLPVSHIKFPFIFGSGGSPCGLYRDLKNLKDKGSVWSANIQIGMFKAPGSCGGKED